MTKFSVLALLLLGLLCAGALGLLGLNWNDHRATIAAPVLLEAPNTSVQAVSELAAPPAAAPAAPVGVTTSQSFALHGGWNAIYLEVEPVNTSPLVNVGTESEPVWVPERSTMEDVFANLGCSECLESVWSWNTPQSTRDYIVDPSEGLWDEPGWKHYFPAYSVDENGVSLDFLTDLLSLHAHTAYLVKLADAAGAVNLTVTGTPTVRGKRWTPNSYNLSGFPIQPGENPVTLDFLAGSPITQTQRLTAQGVWTTTNTTSLAHGQAYMFYHDGATADATNSYAGPLTIEEPLADGLQFRAGGNRASFTLANHSDTPTQITLTLPTGAGVALQISEPVTQKLWEGNAVFSLTAAGTTGSAVRVSLAVLSAEQPQDGLALLEISSDQGVRWQLAVSAESSSRAGLWVGEVTVNDVSESRLGATNVASGTLAISLRSRNDSGISGAAEMVRGQGDTATTLTVTLALPDYALPEAHDTPTFIPTVSGYVFQDLNQNGQRDGDEPGLEGVYVQVGGETITTTQDGFYASGQTASGALAVSISSNPDNNAILANYTPAFPVILPSTPPFTTTNALPTSVSLSAADGITAIEPAAYSTQALYFLENLAPPYNDLPYYDSNDDRVEPSINFGYVSRYTAKLSEGDCSTTTTIIPLPDVINGSMTTHAVSQDIGTLAKGYAVAILDAAGAQVACGDTQISTPAQPVTFRVILRVADEGAAPELLPYYHVVTGTQRISAANFSMPEAERVSNNTQFAALAPAMQFIIYIDSNDPLNPFRHKYHPDHDNLTRQFLLFPDNAQPYELESPNIRRSIKMQLVESLGDLSGLGEGASQAEIDALAADLDWGGATWGGRYVEVMTGLHKNDITVKGYFVIRHLLNGDELIAQDYDPK